MEVKHFNKRATIITLSVLGGVLVTAFALDAVDDCEDSLTCDYGH